MFAKRLNTTKSAGFSKIVLQCKMNKNVLFYLSMTILYGSYQLLVLLSLAPPLFLYFCCLSSFSDCFLFFLASWVGEHSQEWWSDMLTLTQSWYAVTAVEAEVEAKHKERSSTDAMRQGLEWETRPLYKVPTSNCHDSSDLKSTSFIFFRKWCLVVFLLCLSEKKKKKKKPQTHRTSSNHLSLWFQDAFTVPSFMTWSTYAMSHNCLLYFHPVLVIACRDYVLKSECGYLSSCLDLILPKQNVAEPSLDHLN